MIMTLMTVMIVVARVFASACGAVVKCDSLVSDKITANCFHRRVNDNRLNGVGVDGKVLVQHIYDSLLGGSGTQSSQGEMESIVRRDILTAKKTIGVGDGESGCGLEWFKCLQSSIMLPRPTAVVRGTRAGVNMRGQGCGGHIWATILTHGDVQHSPGLCKLFVNLKTNTANRRHI